MHASNNWKDNACNIKNSKNHNFATFVIWQRYKSLANTKNSADVQKNLLAKKKTRSMLLPTKSSRPHNNLFWQKKIKNPHTHTPQTTHHTHITHTTHKSHTPHTSNTHTHTHHTHTIHTHHTSIDPQRGIGD